MTSQPWQFGVAFTDGKTTRRTLIINRVIGNSAPLHLATRHGVPHLAAILLAIALAAILERPSVAAVASESDGTSAVVPLPWIPQYLTISPTGKWALGWRQEANTVSGVTTTKALVVDLEQRQTGPETTWSEEPQLGICDSCLCVYHPKSKRLATYSLPDLKPLGEQTLASPPLSPLIIVAGKLVDLPGSGRWRLPNLRPLDGMWLPDSTVSWKATKGKSIWPTEDGWFVDGVVFDEQLTAPLRFCGHPSLIDNVFVVETPSPQASSAAPSRRLSPYLRVLGTAAAGAHRAGLIEIAAPGTLPVPPGLFAQAATVPDLSKFRPRVRLQWVTKSSPPFSEIPLPNHLLARIPCELPPQITYQEFFELKGPLPVAVGERRVVAGLRNFLLVFTFEDSVQRQFVLRPGLDTRPMPIVLGGDEFAKFALSFADGAPVVRAEIPRGPIMFNAESREFEIRAANVFTLAAADHLFESYWSAKRVAPNVSLEDWARSVRERQQVLLARLEKISKRKFTGLPWSVPYSLVAYRENAGSAEVSGCLVIDVNLNQFKDVFERRQAERVARLLPPGVSPSELWASSSPATSSSPIDSAEEPPKSSSGSLAGSTASRNSEGPEQVAPGTTRRPDTATPRAPSSEGPKNKISTTPPDFVSPRTGSGIAPLVVAKWRAGTMPVAIESVANVMLTFLLGTSLFWVSCQFYRSTASAENPFQVPSFLRLAATMMVASLVGASWELVLVGWGHRATTLRGLPLAVAVILGVALAGACRGVLTVVAARWLLRLRGRGSADVVFIYLILVFLPGTALLGAYFVLALVLT